MAYPDFFIVGAPKAGTTALHGALARHPELYMSPVKEPKFFLCQGPPPSQGGPGDAHNYREWIWRPEADQRLFDAAPPAPGAASPPPSTSRTRPPSTESGRRFPTPV